MNERPILDDLMRLKELAPAGYALALHIGLGASRFLLRTYPKDWIAHYCASWIARDPTVKWGFENTGVIHWADVPGAGESAIRAEAARWGLRYGLSVAVDELGSRTIGSFARSDRNFSAAESVEVNSLVQALHHRTAHLNSLGDGLEDMLL